jgi:ParB/RepB/Spo0J family partition protein
MNHKSQATNHQSPITKSVPLDELIPHPGNPNRMSKANLAKLLRNIKQTGRYEPLVVRPYPDRPGLFQIVNGHHRWQVLKELGYKTADVTVWDIDDHEADILLATLNRLGGRDNIEKKLALLERLNKKLAARELAKLLPQTAKQIERLASFKLPAAPATLAANHFANPLVFFVNDTQQQIIEKAMSLAELHQNEKNRAAKRAAALTAIAQRFLDSLNAEGETQDPGIQSTNSES